MADAPLFVRVRGKVLGPLTLAQLRALRDRGQLRRFHEVSADRLTWAPASTLTALFPPEPGAAAELAAIPTVLPAEPSAPAAGPAEWYYTDALGQQQGSKFLEVALRQRLPLHKRGPGPHPEFSRFRADPVASSLRALAPSSGTP